MLSLLTYNIEWGGIGREKLLLEVLKENRADLIVLQEVVRARVAERFARELGMECFIPRGHYRQRVAVLSRFPIRPGKGYSLFPAECNVLRSEIEFCPGQCLTLFGLHLTAPSHLAPMEAVRLLQARFLSRLLRPREGVTLLAGDLNAVAHGDRVDVHRMPMYMKSLVGLQGGHQRWTIPEIERAGYVDAFRVLHPDDTGFTVPARHPHIRLDYALVPKNMRERIVSCEAVTKPAAVLKASDHLPVRMEIELG